MKELLFMDSAFKIHYLKNGVKLGQYPQKSIISKGMSGYLASPTLIYCVQKEVAKNDKKLVEIKPKEINDQKRSSEPNLKSSGNKRKRAKLKISSML